MEKRFILDSSLGKLAKWVRILGFDARCQSGPTGVSLFSFAKENRIILTRTEKIRDENPGFPLIFIRSNNPRKQLKQVIEEADIRFSETKPFSRCVRCNSLVVPIDREKTRGKIPDYVFQTRRTFRQCPRCERIFWSGTHLQRATEPIRELFEHVGH